MTHFRNNLSFYPSIQIFHCVQNSLRTSEEGANLNIFVLSCYKKIEKLRNGKREEKLPNSLPAHPERFANIISKMYRRINKIKGQEIYITSGFTLIEPVMAVAIMGIVLAPMFLLETNVFTAMARSAERFHRLIFAKNFLYTAQQQEPIESSNYTLEKKEDRPLSMVRYSLQPISPQSSLGGIKRLYRQEVVASGLQKDSPEARIVHFIYKPEPVPS
jgi:prepilin-type N-terminal cleavage/methylation domain-containing protein